MLSQRRALPPDARGFVRHLCSPRPEGALSLTSALSWVLMARWSFQSLHGDFEQCGRSGSSPRGWGGASRLGVCLHHLPAAVVTNNHKSQLKQYTLIILQFRRSGIQIKVSSGGSREESISCPFPASRNTHIPWLVAPNHPNLCLHLHLSSLALTLLPG